MRKSTCLMCMLFCFLNKANNSSTIVEQGLHQTDKPAALKVHKDVAMKRPALLPCMASYIILNSGGHI